MVRTVNKGAQHFFLSISLLFLDFCFGLKNCLCDQRHKSITNVTLHDAENSDEAFPVRTGMSRPPKRVDSRQSKECLLGAGLPVNAVNSHFLNTSSSGCKRSEIHMRDCVTPPPHKAMSKCCMGCLRM